MPKDWISLDYGHLLFWLGRLPPRLGRCLAAWRGRLYAILKRDWRAFSFADPALYTRTQQALRDLRPDASARELARLLRQRYVAQSLEEYEAARLIEGGLQGWPVRYEGLEALQRHLAATDGDASQSRLVFVTAHFGSSILGTGMLHVLGLPVLGMSSKVVDLPQVHPAIGWFFRRKYQALRAHLRGGWIQDHEGNIRVFARFLSQPGAIVVVGDLPPGPTEQPHWCQALGQTIGVAPGAVKLARLKGAHVLAFVCARDKYGHVLRFSAPGQDPYDFLFDQIRRCPELWWAADLYPLYPRQQRNEHHH